MAQKKVYKVQKTVKVYKTTTSKQHTALMTAGSTFEGTDLGRNMIRIDKIYSLKTGSGLNISTKMYVGKEANTLKIETNAIGTDNIGDTANTDNKIKNKTKEYTVTGSSILVYGDAKKTSKNIGKIDKGYKFSAKDLGDNSDFLQIVSIKASKETNFLDFNKKYIKKEDVDVGKKAQITSETATTDATTDENGNPETTTDNPNGTEALDLITPEPFYIDENFAQTYTTDIISNNNFAGAEEQYRKELEALSINDIRGVLGIPHQFLATTDPRIDSVKNSSIGNDITIGRVYGDKIIKQMPLLLLTPGIPSFMASFSEEQKGIALTNLISNRTDSSDLDSLVNSTSGKYYILRYAYTEYFYYVNAMLRAAAVFLGIEGETVGGKKLGSFNWLYYTTDPGPEETADVDNGDNTTTSTTKNTDIFGSAGLHKFLGPYKGCIAMYADCGNSVDDSFSNSTTTSQLASSLNSLSDTGREMNFLLGNAGALVNLDLSKLAGQESLLENMENMTSMVDKALGNNGILSNILGKAQTILAGGRIIFPEIWADSSFSRSYSCKLKLVSPSGDKLSIFLNILVPIYHILALTLPRQASGGDGRTDGQAYFSPFLVRGFCKGLFNIDMGIITDLSISKGSEGEWTIDGIPTVAEISFSIKDMYDGMFMSRSADIGDRNILSNTTELDYIANSCGININDQEVSRTLKMYLALGFLSAGNITDKIQIGIFGNIQQFFNQKVHNIFGVFD